MQCRLQDIAPDPGLSGGGSRRRDVTQSWPRSRRFGLQGDVRQDQSRIWCQAGGKQRDQQTALPQMAISAHLGRILRAGEVPSLEAAKQAS